MAASRMNRKQQVKRLAWREYVPMGATIAMWAIIVAAIGHADAARLLAAITMMRAAQMLTKLATPLVLKRRLLAPMDIRRQAKRVALALQAGSFVITVLLVTALVLAMDAIGQDKIAAFIPYVAIGMPARRSIWAVPPPPKRWQCAQFASRYDRARCSRGNFSSNGGTRTDSSSQRERFLGGAWVGFCRTRRPELTSASRRFVDSPASGVSS